MRSKEYPPTNFLSQMKESVDPGHLPLCWYMLVGEAYHIVHTQGGLNLAQYHHVQLFPCQGICLILLVKIMVSVKEMVAVTCIATSLTKELVQQLD